MSIEANCPSCMNAFEVDDASRGKKVRCPGCGMVFMAGGAVARDDDEPNPARGDQAALPPAQTVSKPKTAAPPPPAKSKTAAPAKPKTVAPAPAAKAKTAAKAAPTPAAPKRKTADKGQGTDWSFTAEEPGAGRRDDGEERPSTRRRKKAGAGLVMLVLGIIGGVVLLCCGAPVGAYLYYRARTAPDEAKKLDENLNKMQQAPAKTEEDRQPEKKQPERKDTSKKRPEKQ